MSEKFQGKYRIESTRLKTWDYGDNGAYFITICTKNREHYFGEINNGKMVLSHVGVIADILWYEIKNHAKNVELDAFIVMPNHIHGILILNDPDPLVMVVDTGHALYLQPSPTQTGNPPPDPADQQTPSQKRYQNQGKNTVSSMIGSYKSAMTRHARRLGWEFEWQSRFHDHIIRDDAAFERIKNYIINNPKNWKEDKFFPPE